MKFKKEITVAVVIVILIFACMFLWWMYRDAVRTGNRYQSNFDAVTKQVQYYKDVNGGLVVSIQDIELTKRELKNTNDVLLNRMADEYRNNGKKIRRLESLLFIQQKISDSLSSVIGDTVIIHWPDSGFQISYDSMKVAKFNDGYLNAKVYIRDTTAGLSYTYIDSLFISMYWDRRDVKWLGVNWNCIGLGRKEYYTDAEFSNPKSKVEYAKKVVCKRHRD